MAGSKKGKGRKMKKGRNSEKQDSASADHSPRSSSGQLDIDGEKKIYEDMCNKIEDALQKALRRLEGMNYHTEVAERAMLRAGLIIGDEDIVTNIVRSSISYIENCAKSSGGYDPKDFLTCESISSFTRKWIKTLENVARSSYPHDTSKSDLLSDMLHSNLLAIRGTGERDNKFNDLLRTGRDQIVKELGLGGHEDHESSCSRVPELISTTSERKQLSISTPKKKNLKSEIGWLDKYSDLQEWFENSPDDDTEKKIKLKDLVKDLEDRVKEKQDWAEKKEMELSETEEKHSLSLSTLRLETLALEGVRKDKEDFERVQINRILERASEIARRVEHITFLQDLQNTIKQDTSDLQTDLPIWRQDMADLKKQLKQATIKEKKDLLLIETNDADIMKLEEEKLENNKLQQRLRDANEAREKLQLKLKNAKAEKDRLKQLCSEERRLLKIEENISQQTQRLRREAKQDNELENEDLFQRIKDFADRQMMPYPSSGDLGDYVPKQVGIKPHSSKIPYHKRCVVCNRKEACVLFMPCSHSAVCWDCNARVEECCPICQIQVQKKIGLCEDRATSSDHSPWI